jgi:hypothetical protein
MPSTVSEKTKVKSDEVICELSDGSTTIVWDIAAEGPVTMANGAHTVNKFTSQKIKAQGVVKDGTYEAVSPTVVFAPAEADQIETWWKKGTSLTYTVTGLYDEPKVYSECQVRIATPPSITPGAEDYVTLGIEITSLENVSVSAAE